MGRASRGTVKSLFQCVKVAEVAEVAIYYRDFSMPLLARPMSQGIHAIWELGAGATVSARFWKKSALDLTQSYQICLCLHYAGVRYSSDDEQVLLA
jgi:hypothetical protein